MMVKWAKKMGCSVKDLHLLPMQKTNKLLAINNKDEKAKILTERFSPQPAPADFNNIINKALMTCLRVNNNMTIKEMARTISCLPNNKALKSDRIPNKILKTCSSLITFWLADVAKAYFAISHYLRLRRCYSIYIKWQLIMVIIDIMVNTRLT